MEIKVNIGILISMLINFGIIYRIFNKYVSKPLIAMIQTRRDLTNKLENADAHYQEIISEANLQASQTAKEANEKKNALIAEAKNIAKQEEEKIILQAEKKATIITEKAALDAERHSQDLAANFEQGVKDTVEVVVKKLLKNDTALESEYIETLIKEAKTAQ
jgi:F0F1-type ATP synthase membrane subunit b/b'